MKLVICIALYAVSLFAGDYIYYLQYGHSIGQCAIQGKCQ